MTDPKRDRHAATLNPVLDAMLAVGHINPRETNDAN